MFLSELMQMVIDEAWERQYYPAGGNDMDQFQLVDKMVCVKCGVVKYRPSTGKSSRSFTVVCAPVCEVSNGVSKEVASKGKS